MAPLDLHLRPGLQGQCAKKPTDLNNSQAASEGASEGGALPDCRQAIELPATDPGPRSKESSVSSPVCPDDGVIA